MIVRRMFVHRIDPVLGQLGGVYLWWYGLSYALGFLELHLWFRWRRAALGFTSREVWDLSLLVPACVIAGGRLVEVIFYEWPYYSAHPGHILLLSVGGMSTHGLLLGAAAGLSIFCLANHKSFLRMADELVIPGALLMGLGRIGNFIDGQIIGSFTTMPWGVKFPDAEGFRHPVVLYDGIKNLLLVPLLISIRDHTRRRGIVFSSFLFLYAVLRIPIDVFREYPTRLFGLATGQSLNIAMSIAGLSLLAWYRSQSPGGLHELRAQETRQGLLPRRLAFVALLLLCLVMPSDWTQDVPARYGKRHPGIGYSLLYPHIG
jgi:phosphatidylglycerol:prolipoprotein diacylglycerol transferase